ncbi:MAG: glycosyltransferase family 4 protein [Planctomycetota bacterium]|jgi:glycosyltransferase involved in cell wall biosynthesis
MMIAFKKKKKVAFISSYFPRKCGIATFTSDLINNVKFTGGEEFEPQVFAMELENESQCHELVKLRIRKNVKYDYISVANYINSSDIDILSIQHEFGLFGGQAGSYIVSLLKKLNKPVITTLHTVLGKPSAEYVCCLTDVCAASDKIIVMNKRGIKMLQDIYGVSKSKIRLIPHGIPDLPYTDSRYYKRKLGITGRRTILTFGLLSKNKGIEIMLRALPAIIKADPTILYIVLGVTHPEVVRHEGQSYRLKLEKIVRDLGLQKNVVFHNSFIDNEELLQFLGAADIYVTPYLHKEQLTSGTLAFAVGTGRAVISTPYWAAQELLAQGRGKLVRTGDCECIARSIVEILSDNSLFYRMKKRAYAYGRSMTWPMVGQAYWKLFNSQRPSPQMPLRVDTTSQDWRIPFYNQQTTYQSA